MVAQAVLNTQKGEGEAKEPKEWAQGMYDNVFDALAISRAKRHTT